MKKITAQQKATWFKAVMENDIETVKNMLEEDCDVKNIKDGEGWTALHWVCYCGQIETAKLLIDNGADVSVKDNYLRIPLHLACYYGHFDTTKLLLDNGLDANIMDNYGWTSLHIACYWGQIETAKLLMDNGADVTARDKDGYTPLDRLKGKHPQQYEELMVWLTEHHPEKMLEYMSKENSPSKGVGL